MTYVYVHHCVWRGYWVEQGHRLNEPVPSVTCPSCGARYTLREVRDDRIRFSKANDPADFPES